QPDPGRRDAWPQPRHPAQETEAIRPAVTGRSHTRGAEFLPLFVFTDHDQDFPMSKAVERALISVSDKSGLVDFAAALAARGIHLLSTGGTFRALKDAGIAVQEVSDYTGFPEMMDGRVKTLHPKIHGGILGRRGQDDAVMAEHGIGRIDLVVVNLYPFKQT